MSTRENIRLIARTASTTNCYTTPNFHCMVCYFGRIKSEFSKIQVNQGQ